MACPAGSSRAATRRSNRQMTITRARKHNLTAASWTRNGGSIETGDRERGTVDRWQWRRRHVDASLNPEPTAAHVTATATRGRNHSACTAAATAGSHACTAAGSATVALRVDRVGGRDHKQHDERQPNRQSRHSLPRPLKSTSIRSRIRSLPATKTAKTVPTTTNTETTKSEWPRSR